MYAGISKSDLLIYASYLNIFFLAIKAILFVVAEFVVRPKALSKLDFFNRVRVTFIPLENESSIFSGETRKLKIFRLLWIIIFFLLFVRIAVGFLMGRLEF